jgi:hypothetical protein
MYAVAFGENAHRAKREARADVMKLMERPAARVARARFFPPPISFPD